MIPQRRERLPALRAAIPAPGKVPDHLNTRQMRVIPPPRPRPRAPLNALLPAPRLPATAASGIITGTAGRLRAVLLRGPAEHHPLQHRHSGPKLLQLSRLRRVLLTQPRILLAHPRVIPAQLLRRLRELPVRLQRRSQRIPQPRLSALRNRVNTSRNRHHAPQQTPSAAAKHAEHANRPQFR